MIPLGGKRAFSGKKLISFLCKVVIFKNEKKSVTFLSRDGMTQGGESQWANVAEPKIMPNDGVIGERGLVNSLLSFIFIFPFFFVIRRRRER